MSEIEKAKEVLRKAGYFIDNLWHIDDVKIRYNCEDDEQAQEILYSSLTNDWIMEQIHYCVGDYAENEGLKSLEDKD